jgi:NAD(P)-dependent dehydrogenase (short-subunit alcohol dehydrogenase family)
METPAMNGRTCVITGGNSGIGKATAAALVRAGAGVVIVGRDEGRLQQAAADLRSSGPDSQVGWVVCDLESLESVRRAAAAILADHPRIQVLVNNAGVWLPERRESVDGFETTFHVNYLSHFLLTHLLLDALKANAPARIVNVASTHRGVKLDFDDLMMERKYSKMGSMGRTKLAMVLFTKTLARELAGTGVTVNSLHPGLAKTNLTKGMPLFARAMQLLAKPPEEAARTSIYLASSPEVEGVSGQFFIKCKPAKTVGQANDAAAERRLWETSMELCGLAGR